LTGIALLNQNFDGVLQMDAVFGYVPVASVVTTVFGPVHVRLDGQLLRESNDCFFEIGTRDLG
ncbi:hypothetical protein A2U01_0111171, partial [Trifolium medium]|nr:hypothetical protein [Trifolium medium]